MAESCRTPSADDLVTSGFSVYNEYCAKAGMAIPSIPWVVTSVAAGSGERAGQPTGVFGAGSGSGSGSLGTGTAEFNSFPVFPLTLQHLQVYPAVRKSG